MVHAEDNMDKPWLKHYEPGVPATIVYPNTSIWGLLRTSFEEYSGNKALTMTLRYLPLGLKIGVTFTYRQLQDKVDRLANAFAGMGVKKGDRIALQAPNSPGGVIAFLAGGIIEKEASVHDPNVALVNLLSQLQDSGA